MILACVNCGRARWKTSKNDLCAFNNGVHDWLASDADYKDMLLRKMARDASSWKAKHPKIVEPPPPLPNLQVIGAFDTTL
jgi:hypothetical protein